MRHQRLLNLGAEDEPIPPGLKRAEFMRVLQERIETRSMELLPL